MSTQGNVTKFQVQHLPMIDIKQQKDMKPLSISQACHKVLEAPYSRWALPDYEALAS